MDQVAKAKALAIALEELVQQLEKPMTLASDMDDRAIKKAIGKLAAELIAQVDLDIQPLILEFIKAHEQPFKT